MSPCTTTREPELEALQEMASDKSCPFDVGPEGYLDGWSLRSRSSDCDLAGLNILIQVVTLVADNVFSMTVR